MAGRVAGQLAARSTDHHLHLAPAAGPDQPPQADAVAGQEAVVADVERGPRTDPDPARARGPAGRRHGAEGAVDPGPGIGAVVAARIGADLVVRLPAGRAGLAELDADPGPVLCGCLAAAA